MSGPATLPETVSLLTDPGDYLLRPTRFKAPRLVVDLPDAGVKAAKPDREFGCLMAPIPQPLLKEIQDWVIENLRDEHLGADGRELDPHVTVKFGFTDDGEETQERLRAMLLRHGPVQLILGSKLSTFPEGKDGVPLKIDVISPQLHQLNFAVTAEFPTETKHPTYVPHLTLGYLRAGAEPFYVKLRPPFLGRVAIVDRLRFGLKRRDAAPVELPLTPRGFLASLVKSAYPWRRVGGQEDRRATVNGVELVVTNLTREVGRRQWNLGVRRSNGIVDWVEAGSSLSEIESMVPAVVRSELDTRSKGMRFETKAAGSCEQGEQDEPTPPEIDDVRRRVRDRKVKRLGDVTGAAIGSVGAVAWKSMDAATRLGVVRGIVHGQKGGFSGKRTDKNGVERCYEDGKQVSCGGDESGQEEGSKPARRKKNPYGDDLPAFDADRKPKQLVPKVERLQEYLDKMPDALADPEDGPAWGPDGMGWPRTMLDRDKMLRVFGEDGVRELKDMGWISKNSLTDGTDLYLLTRTAKAARIASDLGLESFGYPESQADLSKMIRAIRDGVITDNDLREHLGLSESTIKGWGERWSDGWAANISRDLNEMLYRRHNPVPIQTRIAKNKAAQKKVESLSNVWDQSREESKRRNAAVHKEIADLEAEIESMCSEMTKIQSQMYGADATDEDRQRLQKQLDAIAAEFDGRRGNRMGELQQERSRLRQQIQKEMVDGILRVKNATPVYAESFDDSHTEQEKEAVGESARWLNSKIARGPNGESLPGFNVIKDDKPTTGRPGPSAYYRNSQFAINVHSGMTNVSTNVHEMGHGIEYRMPGAQTAAQRFLKHRVKDEPLRKLKEVAGSGFGDWEEGRKDKFEEAFGPHDAWYVGKKENGAATEVVSMGIEKLYDDPAGFAKKDPEYCAFIVGILDGSLRDNPIP